MNNSTNSRHDDILAGSMASVVSLIGDTLMILVIIGCYRIPSMKSSFGILTINQNLAEIIPCTASLIVYLFGLTLNIQKVIDYCYIVGSISLIMLYIIMFGFFMISFNRLCAIAFPLAYKYMFAKKHLVPILVVGWLIPFAMGLYITVYQQCTLHFVRDDWCFTQLETQKCGSKLIVYVAAQAVPATVIILTDLSTLVLFIVMSKRIHKFQSPDIKRREINFARQVLVQGFVFAIRGFWYTGGRNVMPEMNENWKIYWTTSFSASLFHVFDPLVVFTCNMEFRNWMLGEKKRRMSKVGTVIAQVSRSMN